MKSGETMTMPMPMALVGPMPMPMTLFPHVARDHDVFGRTSAFFCCAFFCDWAWLGL